MSEEIRKQAEPADGRSLPDPDTMPPAMRNLVAQAVVAGLHHTLVSAERDGDASAYRYQCDAAHGDRAKYRALVAEFLTRHGYHHAWLTPNEVTLFLGPPGPGPKAEPRGGAAAKKVVYTASSVRATNAAVKALVVGGDDVDLGSVMRTRTDEKKRTEFLVVDGSAEDAALAEVAGLTRTETRPYLVFVEPDHSSGFTDACNHNCTFRMVNEYATDPNAAAENAVRSLRDLYTAEDRDRIDTEELTEETLRYFHSTIVVYEADGVGYKPVWSPTS